MNYVNIILKSLDKFAQNFVALIPNIIIGVFFAVLTFFIAKIIGKIVSSFLPKMAIRANLVTISHKLTIILVWFIGVLIISAIVFPSVTTANILTTLGLTSVAVGLAFKNIFENFFTGILLLLREPFSIGDFIEVDSQRGYVHRISIQNTHLRKTDGTRAFIPNTKMFTSTVEVLTDSKLRRKKIICSVDFGTDLEKARTTIKNAVKQCESVSKEKYTQIYVVSFSSNGIDFAIYWWTKPEPSHLRYSLDEVLTSIKKALDKEKIPMTYSTPVSFIESMTVHPKTQNSKPEDGKQISSQ
ncbi:mechanosensitive ion channel family protein [Legionella longbeachae]|uniref:Small-conductance mechanosensitive channel n=1 Tax=Legionella longbeachae serogroup 1 (strain NSW150) TaxID=661367 RepID=D3HS90_LEGLN|nr:mechanosensitive ion channel domain-containing protein [Legionella longbeachae]VEE02274.1 mechanosensitive ion channel MscS [Legionella oakridgensis]ARB91433.1 mechanosensitive ion channel protein MscS [Legionella longbeachae]EEZ95089.1 small conductance mechanosensitive ion channel family transporter [Legionella longbeachae D-4968]QEY51358.1 mechanosensitive ion channel [Legionella longbeachae]QIN32142.1 mechanosensitive ion channel [Legionella longbeachae]